eukprot:COSAG03_NODE_304_length_9180_cov_78.498293_11_plen_75_part_00
MKQGSHREDSPKKWSDYKRKMQHCTLSLRDVLMAILDFCVFLPTRCHCRGVCTSHDNYYGTGDKALYAQGQRSY